MFISRSSPVSSRRSILILFCFLWAYTSRSNSVYSQSILSLGILLSLSKDNRHSLLLLLYLIARIYTLYLCALPRGSKEGVEDSYSILLSGSYLLYPCMRGISTPQYLIIYNTPIPPFYDRGSGSENYQVGSEFEREGSEHRIDLRPSCLSLLRTIDTPSLTSIKLVDWPPAYRRAAQVLAPYHVIRGQP